MWCAHCLRPVNGTIDHEPCKEAVWAVMSEEFTKARKAMQQQYEFVTKGATVEVRAPLTRSASR